MFGRRRIAALVAEFLGTGVLTLVILSVQRSQIGVPFFVALAAGLALALSTLIFARVSGAHFNPAVTLGMWTARKINTFKAIGYIAFQLLGAYAAYLLYTYFVDNKLDAIGGEYSSRILVAEAVGAIVLGMGFAAVVAQRLSVGARAATTGLAYMLAIIAASSVSIGLINPAVAFGVQAWEWGTYILGPVLGAVIGFNLYNLLFASSANDELDAKDVVAQTSVVTVAQTDNESTVTTAKSTTVKKPRATRAKASAARSGTRSTTKKVPAKRATTTRRKK